MKRIIAALLLASVLAACEGGNPNDAGNDDGVGKGAQPLIPEPDAEEDTDGGGGGDGDGDADGDDGDGDNPDANGDEIGADTDPNHVYADGDLLRMNNMRYDAATDEVVFNNIPFDGEDNLYRRDPVATAGLQANGFNTPAYRNVDGFSDFYAVFRRSPSGYAQFGAVATDRYLGFGFGGASAQRLSGTGALPRTDEQYVFTGEYAAVRTVFDDSGTAVQYVAGTVELEVDVEDFDVPGAVEGLIVDRRFFDANGVRIGSLDNSDFIQLRTAEINFDTWTIESSSASSVSLLPDGTPGITAGAAPSGTWEGLFAGPNGEEVVGIVVVEGEGPVGIDPATGDYISISVRETGGFVTER